MFTPGPFLWRVGQIFKYEVACRSDEHPLLSTEAECRRIVCMSSISRTKSALYCTTLLRLELRSQIVFNYWWQSSCLVFDVKPREPVWWQSLVSDIRNGCWDGHTFNHWFPWCLCNAAGNTLNPFTTSQFPWTHHCNQVNSWIYVTYFMIFSGY